MCLDELGDGWLKFASIELTFARGVELIGGVYGMEFEEGEGCDREEYEV